GYRSHKWAKLEPALLLELQQAQEECPSPELIRDFRVPVGRFSTLLEKGIDLSNRRMEFRLLDEYFGLMAAYQRAESLPCFQGTILMKTRLRTVRESIMAASHTLASLSPYRPRVSFLDDDD